jgi:membrane-bound lytic murein transglycosylase A
VRAFFETHFSPHQITGSDGGDTGRVTGYYEPLLNGSLDKTARFSVPLYAVPDDLLVVELADLYPELKGKRVRGRVEGRRVVPYWSRADIERGELRFNGKPLLYVVSEGLAGQAQSLKRNRPATRIEVFGQSGHALFVDEPERFNALLADFVSTLPQ